MGLEVKNAEIRFALAVRLEQHREEVDHEESEIDGVGDSLLRDIHEILQSPILFGIAEVELNLEAQAVIIDQLPRRQAQVGAEQQDMRPFAVLTVRFDQHHQVEGIGKIFVHHRQLVSFNQYIPLCDGRNTGALRQHRVVELAPVTRGRSSSWFAAAVKQIQGGVVAQLGIRCSRQVCVTEVGG